MTKHEPFYTKFDEEWKGMKKKKSVIEQKGMSYRE